MNIREVVFHSSLLLLLFALGNGLVHILHKHIRLFDQIQQVQLELIEACGPAGQVNTVTDLDTFFGLYAIE